MDPEHILNWRRLSAKLTTSGQPNQEQLAEIKDLGVTDIINLAPDHSESALANEADKVAALGMSYIYIPVEFDRPTDRDFEEFRFALQARPQATIHVHCIYNARVSAFFYRYAKMGFGLSIDLAKTNMESIWRPGADWAAFIEEPSASGEPNRYAGKDY